MNLDRMAVDDIPTDPVRKVLEIHRQFGTIQPPVPVDEIARALDIEEIVASPMRGYEGLLITDPQRDRGVIQVNSSSSAQRRRFSIGHELGHFLCGWHNQVTASGFMCTRSDMSAPTGNERHIMQEREANAFSIELLAPSHLAAPHLKRLPDLERVLDLHQRLHISKAAAARRYAGLHTKPVAIIFARHSRFLYAERSAAFPFLPLNRNELLPDLPASKDGQLSDVVEVDPEPWFKKPHSADLAAQILQQQDGHSMILLHIELEF